jgi:hypothetical protein
MLLSVNVQDQANQVWQSLGYHYVRTLIHRPAVGSSLGNKAASSVIALAQSSKHIIQIIQLLEERRMSFSFCLNKTEFLLLAGFGLLFQGLNLDRKGKLIKDSQRLLCSVIQILEQNGAPGAADFKRVACAMMSVDRMSGNARARDEPTVLRRGSYDNMPAPRTASKSARKFQAIASRFSSSNAPVIDREGSNGRRSTAPTLPMADIPLYARSSSSSHTSVWSSVSDPLTAQCSKRTSTSQSPGQIEPSKPPNLDYLSFNNDLTPSPQQQVSPDTGKTIKQDEHNGIRSGSLKEESQPSLVGLLASADIFSSNLSPPPSANVDWYSDAWNLTSDLSDQPAQSRVSFSEEEFTSGEELSNCDIGGEFNGMTMSAVSGLVGLDGIDGDFVL